LHFNPAEKLGFCSGLNLNREPKRTRVVPLVPHPAIARAKADYHIKSPVCSQWFDMHDLAQVVEHIHDSEVEVLEGPEPPREGPVH
jgi:hypothetical protein